MARCRCSSAGNPAWAITRGLPPLNAPTPPAWSKCAWVRIRSPTSWFDASIGHRRAHAMLGGSGIDSHDALVRLNESDVAEVVALRHANARRHLSTRGEVIRKPADEFTQTPENSSRAPAGADSGPSPPRPSRPGRPCPRPHTPLPARGTRRGSSASETGRGRQGQTPDPRSPARRALPRRAGGEREAAEILRRAKVPAGRVV